MLKSILVLHQSSLFVSVLHRLGFSLPAQPIPSTVALVQARCARHFQNIPSGLASIRPRCQMARQQQQQQQLLALVQLSGAGGVAF